MTGRNGKPVARNRVLKDSKAWSGARHRATGVAVLGLEEAFQRAINSWGLEGFGNQFSRFKRRTALSRDAPY